MKLFAKYWKILLALILVIAAVVIYFNVYKTEEAAYEAQVQNLQSIITMKEKEYYQNLEYADIQDELDAAIQEITDSRLKLYKRFPVELKEEDQIMYVLYLETMFGDEINFSFSDTYQFEPALKDGSYLQYILLEVNYETSYKGFQEMIEYLATDSRITSVYDANIQYNAAKDKATGTVTLMLYMIDSDLLEYAAPDVATPEIGKDNIFD